MSITASAPQWDITANQPELMLANLSHLGLIEVTGEQGRSFIHGQVTTDISSLTAEQWRWGAHCDAKGKMIASFRTFSIAESLFLLMPTETISVDLPQLKKYAVFSKAELEDASANWQLIGVAGTSAKSFMEQQFGTLTGEVTPVEGGVILQDQDRYIAVLSPAAADNLSQQQNLVDATAWQALEIRAGYPNISATHANQYVPQMCNLQAIDGISFTKGCYMGQETIARMKYRGGNKRALYILQGTTTQTLAVNDKVEIALEDGYRKAGNIIEFVQQGNNVLLTAVLANDTESSATLRIADDEQSSLTVQPLPYSLED
ncbi:tRNA-modifying protein YgfZ [Shewanella gaetbuli]|uniref:tRNA-modifying protein YgfZ n=1 Tax=Shewanella gaetbuli TaxID=220752 RepID=A0A9X2CMW1_9GAMM|nr:tRNA-modifying protein YgfZ [Shewanella gaetbuli]MCL1144080.1 tRNA-modifying protein YgfZ [Shewanella gaetbuli]